MGGPYWTSRENIRFFSINKDTFIPGLPSNELVVQTVSEDSKKVRRRMTFPPLKQTVFNIFKVPGQNIQKQKSF